jgi:predicted metallo-beta-lactamase superfamily hydrolase
MFYRNLPTGAGVQRDPGLRLQTRRYFSPPSLFETKNYRKLRRAGVTVRKTIDVMIATFCIVNRHRLLHTDRDFDPIEKHLSLRVLRP